MANPKLAQSAGDRRQQCSFSNVGAAIWGLSLARVSRRCRGCPPGGPPWHWPRFTRLIIWRSATRRSHVLKIAADVGTGYSMMSLAGCARTTRSLRHGDGKIAEWWVTWDNMTILRQRGHMRSN